MIWTSYIFFRMFPSIGFCSLQELLVFWSNSHINRLDSIKECNKPLWTFVADTHWLIYVRFNHSYIGIPDLRGIRKKEIRNKKEIYLISSPFISIFESKLREFLLLYVVVMIIQWKMKWILYFLMGCLLWSSYSSQQSVLALELLHYIGARIDNSCRILL